jgi:hypothetical protein
MTRQELLFRQPEQNVIRTIEFPWASSSQEQRNPIPLGTTWISVDEDLNSYASC